MFHCILVSIVRAPNFRTESWARPIPVHATSYASILSFPSYAFLSCWLPAIPTCCVCYSGQGRVHATGAVLQVARAGHLCPAFGPEDHQADMLLQPSGQSMGQQV